jgi:Beta-lactamase
MKRQQPLRQLPRGLSQLKIDRHVIDPPHVRGVQIEEVDERKEKFLRTNLPNLKFKTKPRLDEAAFCTALHTILKDNTTGYILHLRKNGALTHNLVWQWAQTPSDKNDSWTESTRMHVASVSKLLTAIGMVKALDSKNISYDTPIVGYLPEYWAKGNKVNQITFRHLLTHTSGFNTAGSDSNYGLMKTRVAMGVSYVGASHYENMNFGLCRILMPILLGEMPKDASFVPNNPSLNDKVWDAVSLHHYTNYMQDNVFTPAGVSNAGYEPIPGKNTALAYPFPHKSKKGWDSGDLASMAGGAAWRLSIKEVLDVLHHARRKNTILPSGKFQYLLDNYFGIDQQINTPAGKLYNKNGGWTREGVGKEQCVVYLLPDNRELAVFVNSPIGTEDYSLRGLVKDAYVGCLSE